LNEIYIMKCKYRHYDSNIGYNVPAISENLDSFLSKVYKKEEQSFIL
jgi:hypothetical protein